MLATLLALSLQSPMFPFVVPWDDSVAGTATDVSFLNAMPAGKNGWITAKDGRFVESKTGSRIRFFGTNVTAKMAFPPKDDADKVAARMAKLGINIVRFHHLQNTWAQDGGMIWKPGKLYLELDPDAVDRMDYFIAALKKKGIYSNINLQTTRNYIPEMGFPASVRDIKFNYAKKIDKIDTRMIELQKQYARDLIGRKNPYTGLTYAEDPAIMVVEINNENSLVGWPGEVPGEGLRNLPEPFLSNVKRIWTHWLKAKYSTDAALLAAWSKGVTPDGPSIVTGTRKWSWENQSNGDVKAESPDGSANDRFAPPLKITVNSNAGPDWHVQAHVTGLDLKEGDTYTLRFKARSSKAQSVRVSATLDVDDWRNLGLNPEVPLKTDWQDYKFSFRAGRGLKDHARIAFALGSCRGTIEIRELSVSPGLGGAILGSGESLERGLVDLPEGGTATQMEDYLRFLTETETAYSNNMRKFLREDLGFKNANIVDTQIAWGGLTSLTREANMEFADNHAYWQHPNFPGSEWDGKNWVVGQRAHVNEFEKGWGALGGLATFRVANKPYAISEYCHPAPNDFQAEMMPLFANFAALQDWDMIYTFDYGYAGAGHENDKIQGFFAVGSNPAKAAYFPSAALTFRQGLMPVAPDWALLTTQAEPWKSPRNSWEAWGDKVPDLLRTKVAIRQGTGTTAEVTNRPTRGVTFASARKLPGGMVFLGDASATKSIVGFVGGQSLDLRENTFNFGSFGNGFASLTLTSTDSKSIENSARALLTVMGKAENQGMGWNANRTSVSDQWGKGPSLVEGIPCEISLVTDGPRKVWVLDGNGRRGKEIPVKYSEGKTSFTIGPEYQTAWYEVSK